MKFRYLFAVCAIFPLAAQSASPNQIEALHEALHTDELMVVLSDEGLEQSEELRAEMFPGRSSLGWRLMISSIYAPERMETTFREAFDAELEGADIQPLLEFYEDGNGGQIARLELEARRAISADEVEDAARQAFGALREDGGARLALLEEFAEVNKLIDRNVAGALNANLAFFRGLGSGETFEMPEDQILTDVWSREPEIREDTEGWVFGYMTFAYEPLSDDQLQSYVEIAGTDAGRAMNRALFAGFDALFQQISYDVGAAAAQFSQGDDL